LHLYAIKYNPLGIKIYAVEMYGGEPLLVKIRQTTKPTKNSFYKKE
jgi:hypothetical protein